jgi:hypothetical protein
MGDATIGDLDSWITANRDAPLERLLTFLRRRRRPGPLPPRPGTDDG